MAPTTDDGSVHTGTLAAAPTSWADVPAYARQVRDVLSARLDEEVRIECSKGIRAAKIEKWAKSVVG